MEETLYKIVEAGTGNTQPVEGCESLTLDQVQVWMSENQVFYDEPLESGDTVKYIMMPKAFISHEETPMWEITGEGKPADLE